MSDIKIDLDADTRQADSALKLLGQRMKGLEDSAKANTNVFRSLGGILRFSGVAIGIAIIGRSLSAAYKAAKDLGDSATTSQKAFVKIGDSLSNIKSDSLKILSDVLGDISVRLGLVNKQEMEREERAKRISIELNKQKQTTDSFKSFGAELAKESAKDLDSAIGAVDPKISQRAIINSEIETAQSGINAIKSLPETLSLEKISLLEVYTKRLENAKNKLKEFDEELANTRESSQYSASAVLNEDPFKQFFGYSVDWDKMTKEELEDAKDLIERTFKAEQEEYVNQQNKAREAEKKAGIEAFEKRAKESFDYRKRLADKEVQEYIKEEELKAAAIADGNTSVYKKLTDRISKDAKKMAVEKEKVILEDIDRTRKNVYAELTAKDFVQDTVDAARGVVRTNRGALLSSASTYVNQMIAKQREAQEKADSDKKQQTEENSKKLKELSTNDNINALIEEEKYVEAILELEKQKLSFDKTAADYVLKEYEINKKIEELADRMAKKQDEEIAKQEESLRLEKERKNQKLSETEKLLEEYGFSIDDEGNLRKKTRSGKNVKISEEEALRRIQKKEEQKAKTLDEFRKKNKGKTPEEKSADLLEQIAKALEIQKSKK